MKYLARKCNENHYFVIQLKLMTIISKEIEIDVSSQKNKQVMTEIDGRYL